MSGVTSAAADRAFSPSPGSRSRETPEWRLYEYDTHTYDVVVVRAPEAAGLRATLGMALSRGLKTGCISKVSFRPLATPSPHRAASRASLGNMGPDSWQWAHVRHRQGVGLGSAMSTRWNTSPGRAPKAVYELDHYGVPFSRTEDGKIYPAPLGGGHTTEYGEGPPVQRTCGGRRPDGACHSPHALTASR